MIQESVEPTRWFVAQTAPRKEQIAQEHLQRQAFRSFCPRFLKTRRHARRQDTVLTPLFPGYVFVRFSRSQHGWGAINGTRGVVHLLGNDRGRPQPMPDQIMDALLARCPDGTAAHVLPEIREGHTVRLLSGPFADRLATVEALDDKGRVRVLFDILGGASSILVPQNQLGLA